MKLDSVSVHGFRSVAALDGLAVGRPTLLTGHNDAGKSAILEAVRFLLNDTVLGEDDRTYEAVTPTPGQPTPRVSGTWVEGDFALSAVEQAELTLESSVKIRRISRDGSAAVFQILAAVPDEPRLRISANFSLAT